MSSKIVLGTTPVDKVHFPATNQTHYCWQKYNEFVLCLKKNGGDEDVCKQSRQLAVSICPDTWIEEWDGHRSKGNFLGVQEKAAAKTAHH